MILTMLGQRVSLNRQDGVTQTYTSTHSDHFGTLLQRIFLVTLAIELLGHWRCSMWRLTGCCLPRRRGMPCFIRLVRSAMPA